MPSLVYLHGFASGPRGSKGEHCRLWAEARDIPFHAPDLNLPSFEAPIDNAAELGIKVMRATISEGDATTIYWDIPELPVDPAYDRFFTMTLESG
ncbi:MAG: hypothetical protein HGA66_01710, partial [Holophaga sp.]|nr:hypothetical protein [Holophaga sp.]